MILATVPDLRLPPGLRTIEHGTSLKPFRLRPVPEPVTTYSGPLHERVTVRSPGVAGIGVIMLGPSSSLGRTALPA